MSNSKAKITSDPSRGAANGQDESKKTDTAVRRSKTDLLIELLGRDDGASIEEMVAATGWLPHTTRAALTGLKKKGYVIDSEKMDGVRRYRIAGSAA